MTVMHINNNHFPLHITVVFMTSSDVFEHLFTKSSSQASLDLTPLFFQVGEEMCCVTELQEQQRGNPVIHLKISKDLILIGCVCATPASLVLAHLPQQYGRPCSPPAALLPVAAHGSVLLPY